MLTRSFFEAHWQKRVFWSGPQADDRGCIDRALLPSALLSLRDVEVLLSSLSRLDRDWLQLVKAGKPLAQTAYATADGLVSLPRVRAAYEAGYTIQLAKMHKLWPAVGRLCRAVEAAFLRAGTPLAMRIGSHLYLTPPRSTGLEPHYDNHDVIVIQVEGAKRWSVYGAMQAFPVEMQASRVPRAELPPLEHDVLLEPAHVLYVPRGAFHEASTEERHSIHVTLDITPCTWADLLRRVMRGHPRLRESLPVGAFGRGGGALLREGLAGRRAALADAAGALTPAIAAMLDHFLADLDLLPARGLAQLDRIASVGLDTRLQRGRGTAALILEDAAGPALCFPGASLRGTPGLAAWLCELAEHQPFAVRDLPGELEPGGKIEVARELIGRGFLELVDPAPPPEPSGPP